MSARLQNRMYDSVPIRESNHRRDDNTNDDAHDSAYDRYGILDTTQFSPSRRRWFLIALALTIVTAFTLIFILIAVVQSYASELEHIRGRVTAMSDVISSLIAQTHTHSPRPFDHPRHNDSEYPKTAVVTLTSFNNGYCRMTFTLYRSFRRSHPLREHDFVILYADDTDNNTDMSVTTADAYSALHTDDYCWALYQQTLACSRTPKTIDIVTQQQRVPGCVRIKRIPHNTFALKNESWIGPLKPNWAASLQKVHAYGLIEYETTLFIDSDSVIVNSITPLMSLSADLNAAPDTWGQCEGSYHGINGGVVVAHPSTHLNRAWQRLHRASDSCVTGNLTDAADQEILNCMCGTRASGSIFPHRPDITCQMLPTFVASTPIQTTCKGFRASEVYIYHFFDGPKPWLFTEHHDTCKRTWKQVSSSHDLTWYEDEKRRECFTDWNAVYTFYQCLATIHHWLGHNNTYNEYEYNYNSAILHEEQDNNNNNNNNNNNIPVVSLSRRLLILALEHNNIDCPFILFKTMERLVDYTAYRLPPIH